MSDANQEQVLFKGSSSPVMDAGALLTSALVGVASLAFAFVVPAPMARYGLFALAAAALIFFLIRWFLIKSRVYEVTSERIRVTEGIFTRRTDELELYRVKDTTLIEPLSLRLVSRGHIEVTTNDTTTPILRLEAIKNPRALREELRKSIEQCRDRKKVRLAELE